MPVVTVTAPPLDGVEDVLVALTRAVADALGLPHDGVFATSLTTSVGVLGADRSVWPIVVLHGAPRDPDSMQAAARAAERIVRSAWQADDAWVQWSVRE